MLAQLAGEIEEQQSFHRRPASRTPRRKAATSPTRARAASPAPATGSATEQADRPAQGGRRISSRVAVERIAEIPPSSWTAPRRERRPRGRATAPPAQYVLDYVAGRPRRRRRRRSGSSLYNRAAAHQTTGDNPGLLPQQILQPVLNWVDESRPIVNALGPATSPPAPGRGRGSASTPTWPPQSGEKTELVSRKMVIGMVPVTATTYGGYVNVSRQNIDWTQPAIMDLVINDLAGVYAQETEKALCAAIDAATTAGPVIPTGAATPAAGQRRDLDGGRGGVRRDEGRRPRDHRRRRRTRSACSAPAFPPINPQNAVIVRVQRRRLRAPAPPGSISGVPVVVSAGFDAGTMIVIVDRRGRGVRRPHRQPPGRRAVRARRPGRVRRLLRAARPRAAGDHRDHEDGHEHLRRTQPGRPSASTRRGSRAKAARLVRPPRGRRPPQSSGRPRRDDEGGAARARQGRSGVTPANNDMTKEELAQAIDAHQRLMWRTRPSTSSPPPSG